MLYAGCHLSNSAGNLPMVETAVSIGANTFAFFTRNPRGSQAKKEDPVDSAKAVQALKDYNFGPLVAHGAYTMNLCTAEESGREFAASVLPSCKRLIHKCAHHRVIYGIPYSPYDSEYAHKRGVDTQNVGAVY